MLRTCSTAALLAALAGFAFALPQDDAAAAGPSFQVQARLRIDAARAQRVRLFREVVGRLQAAGLRKDEGWEREEFYTDSLSGQMPARGLAALRRDPAVSAAIAIPANYQAPEAGALVRLYLLTDFGPDGQREAAGKARAALANLGFRESVGYDHDSHRQLLGRLPLARLEALLGDALQIEIPVVPATGSLKSMKQHLVKLAEVLPEPGELPPAAMESAVPPAGLPQGKVHPDLRRAISEAGEGGAGQKLRVEVILRDVPTGPVTAARLGVLGLGLEIQGQVGPMLFATLPAGNVTELASLADVSGIRLPQPARYVAWPSDFTSVSRTPAAVESSPARWLRQGGNNVVAVVAADFSGWEEEVGKELPKNTKLIDLTPELSADLESAAPPAPGDFGVKLAKEVAAALPGTDLLLVRVDSASPFQVTEIARVTSGQLWLTGAFAQRLEEITTERARLVARKEYLQVRRRIALNNFGLEGDDKEAREAYMKEQAQFDEDSKALGAKDARALAFRAATKQLAGVGSVVVGLAWDDGYADLPGTSFLGRWLEPRWLTAASWIQVVPRRTGQLWTGLFRDADQDGAMEFTDESGPARADLNFIEWKPRTEEKSARLLPAGAVLSATLTWKEAHDRRFAGAADDPYRTPLAPLQIVVLRQRDPEGRRMPADVFDVVARSPLLPERLENEPRFAVYQTQVRFQVPSPGRYAIRIEGRVPESIQPPGVPVVRAEQGEIRPILELDVVDPAHRGQGRPTLQFNTPRP